MTNTGFVSKGTVKPPNWTMVRKKGLLGALAAKVTASLWVGEKCKWIL